MEGILDKIIKCSLYSLVFLFSLFFLPLTVFPAALSKQILLSFIIFLVFILWVIKIISSGKISLRLGKLSGTVFLLLVVLGISFIFSSSKGQSFWGTSVEPDTFFNFILYALLFFAFANLLEKEKEIINTVSVFLISSGILAFFFLVSSLFKILPWDFAKIPGFNLIGSAQTLSIFLGGGLVILIALITGSRLGTAPVWGKVISKKAVQGLVLLLGVLLFGTLILINHWVTWIGIIFAITIIILERLYSSGGSRQDILKNFGIPLIVLILCLIFTLVKIPLGNVLDIPPEVMPAYKSTFDIAFKTLQESAKSFILGSGPATFGYQYSLYRSTRLNISPFWQIRFLQGAAALPTFLVTFGVLGILAILLMMFVFFWQGFKNIISADQRKSGPGKQSGDKHQRSSAVQTALFVGGFYFFLSWFFYPADFSLMFATFLMMGLWAGSGSQKNTTKTFSFSQSPKKAFLVMTACVLLVAGMFIGFYTICQKYIAALNYAQAFDLFEEEKVNLDEVIIKLEKAAELDEKDIYFRDLSQTFLLKANEVLGNRELSQEQIQEALQQYISKAELSGTLATEINPQDSRNWLQLGNIYENLISLIEGVDQLALLSYEKAGELDPQNPEIPLSLGRIYKARADILQVQIATLNQSEEENKQAIIEELQDLLNRSQQLALDEIKKSIDLKPDFSPAYLTLAQVYESQGEKEQALQVYRILLQLVPGNEQIKIKIEALEKTLQGE